MSLLPKKSKLTKSRQGNAKPPPPSETTLMLEAMLEKPIEPSKKKQKVTPFSSRSVNANNSNADMNWSNLLSATTNKINNNSNCQMDVFGRAGSSLSDAATFSDKPLLMPKARLHSKKITSNRRAPRQSNELSQLDVETVSSSLPRQCLQQVVEIEPNKDFHSQPTQRSLKAKIQQLDSNHPINSQQQMPRETTSTRASHSLQLGLSLQMGKQPIRRKRTMMPHNQDFGGGSFKSINETCDIPSNLPTLHEMDNDERQTRKEHTGQIESELESSVYEETKIINPNVSDSRSTVDDIHIAASTIANVTKEATKQESFALMRPLAAESNIPRVTRPTATTKENFVRLNLKNHAGACRGARNKAKMNKWRKFTSKTAPEGDQNDKKTSDDEEAPVPVRKEKTAPSGGVDPLDDYLDGVFRAKIVDDAPKCARHQLPCSLRTVKKTGGNKGRKFYSCSMPRGEQCDHFQWAEDTLQAAKSALDRSSTHSGFVARQVSGHLDRFRCLTVDELRIEMKNRNLQATGKRQQLLTRLSIWLRDEIVRNSCCSEEAENITSSFPIDDEDESSGNCPDDDDEDASTSSLELEITLPSNVQSSVKRPNASEANDRVAVEFDADIDEIDTCNESIVEPTKALHSSLMKRCLKEYFGYNSFRDGQEWAILRCLNHQRSLLVAPTGFGKSLCYALPAALMDGVCIVVSPLISLIEDQLRQLPPRIPAVSLSGSLSTAAVVSTIDDIVRGRVKIVFVSPERLASASFQRLFKLKWNSESGKRERLFPVVSLVCVDEAHCASQWGINFRPSYLRIKSLLRSIEPQSVLAITATAVPRVVDDICHSLGVETGVEKATEAKERHKYDSGVLILQSNRENVDVACIMMSNQDERLATLLKILTPAKKSSEKLHPTKRQTLQVDGCLCKGSVIIYVWRQIDADVVAENLLARGVSGGVVIYHGGMDSAARAKSQSKFLRGKARICVATVAFGLGVNKEDVYGVVHMQLPSSPEHYLQEIGRAGRNGHAALAIALVLKDEVVVRHSLAHSDLISKSQIRILLDKMKETVTKAFDAIENSSTTAHVAIPLESFGISCDCKSETIETLLSLMEQRRSGPPLFSFEGVHCNMATISLKQRTLEKLALKEPIARTIKSCASCVDPPVGERHDSLEATKGSFSRHHQFLAYSFGSYSFSVIECANQLGEAAEPRHVFAALRRLQSANEIELALDLSQSGKAIHIKVEEAGRIVFLNPAEDGLNELTDSLSTLWDSVVKPSATKVLDIADMMTRVAGATTCSGEENHQTMENASTSEPNLDAETSQKLFHRISRNYFDGDYSRDCFESKSELPSKFEERFVQELSYDVASLLRELTLCGKPVASGDTRCVKLNDPDFVDYSALAVTKFFHALGTRRAPVSDYGKHRLFGKWRQVRFCSLLDSVTKLLSATVEFKE